MGSWQGVNYEELEPPENPKEASTQHRRAALYRRVKELGHPALFDREEKEHFARKFDISFRQVYYDLEAVREFVEGTLNFQEHVTNVKFVFEKAMAEAIDEGEWDEAADIAMQESEWLERRGVIENKDVKKVEVDHEHDWRQFIEQGSEGAFTEESGEVEVEVDD